MHLTKEQKAIIDSTGIRNKSGWPQLKRGIAALKGEYSNTALKTAAFAELLSNPDSLAICIDSHALMAWTGCHDCGGTIAFNPTLYRLCAEAYAKLAHELDILPHQIQAIVWIVRKRLLAEGNQPTSWFRSWAECKYGSTWLATIDGLRQEFETHPKYSDGGFMPDYTMDPDVALEYGSIDNLRYVLEQAKPDEIIEGMTWYGSAHDDCVVAADHASVGMDPMTECVSALSPGRNWTRNVHAAETLAITAKQLGLLD